MDKAGRVGAKRTRRLPRTAVRARGESASTPVVTPVSTPELASVLDRLKVLVLEDDADTREALGLFLCEDDGFAMEACGDVAACIDLLREGARGGLPTFDVLLLDLLLLDGHVGTEVIDAARADVTIELPLVVVCTAVAPAWLPSYMPILDACGARIVSKPFNMDALQAELRAAAAWVPRAAK